MTGLTVLCLFATGVNSDSLTKQLLERFPVDVEGVEMNEAAEIIGVDVLLPRVKLGWGFDGF